MIERTTIGSFPRTDKPFETAVRDVIDLQLSHGIDVITDGEQRADMITYFEQIPGLGRGSRGLSILGKIEPMGDPDEFYKIKDFRFVKPCLGGGVKGKITLTGPVTLGMTAAMGGLRGYKSIRDPAIYEDCADALIPLARRALEIGALLQIDEPGISARFQTPKYTEKLLSALPHSAVDEEKVSLHVCGYVGKVWDELMSLSVNVFSFGFSRAQESRNMEMIASTSLPAEKRLGVGFISNTSLEDATTSLGRLRRLVGIVGVDKIAYIHPDCGFGSTSPELVEPILKNMEDASDKFFHG